MKNGELITISRMNMLLHVIIEFTHSKYNEYIHLYIVSAYDTFLVHCFGASKQGAGKINIL